MTTATVARPVPVVGWKSTREQWLGARRTGISASDVAAVLGWSDYATPWEVWADKTGVRPREVDEDKEAIRLGVALESWLLAQARHMLGVPVSRTAHWLYRHPDTDWQLASPDGQAVPEDGTPFGLECKTAGLASGFGVPGGWTDSRAPLGYEFQCRWQMRVMGWQRVDLIALVAGLGLRRYTYTRDLAIEADMAAQVAEWRERHLVRGVEPAMGPRDNALMDSTYPEGTEGSIALDNDPDLAELIYSYHDGLTRESQGRAAKEAATAALKRKLGNHVAATVANREVVTWHAKQGSVDYPALLTDLYELLGWDEGPEADTERYRRPPSRQIHVKGINP